MDKERLVFPFGKMKNILLRDIIREHPGYVVWMKNFYEWMKAHIEMIDQMWREEHGTPLS